MNAAREKFRNAVRRTGSALSVGLEPCPEYQFGGLATDVRGYEEAMRRIVEATRGLACAYKLNLAFFESLGRAGTQLLYDVRAMVPEDALLIADAKRGDIGTSASRYAAALFDQLGVDAVTVNPLMGLDSAEAFLSRPGKMTFLLCLTSNPGADDFLVREKLYLRIAEKAQEWDKDRECCGLVVGATRPASVAEIRAAAPTLPFLVPGIGAQGGEIEGVANSGAIAGDAGLLFHVTRGILPTVKESGDSIALIREKATDWHARIQSAMRRREQTS